ncbi:hypothetical protein Pmani_003590 [Petrolisthes manimaculis]|uniref:Major facilitator superfamily (MFS) profile domain-containing protein n=1 Tax=Petrolisthes manimaculis TaxID=1843537 RepID=A0AAE1QGF0_9EUCA|nr:hypothetical protein Pmani_003590 [Petrolisthes manimaculis]
MTEDTGEEGEVVVVVPDRSVHVDELYPGAKSLHGSKAVIHKFEIIAACVMGLSTISGGILEGYLSTALPTLLQDSLSNSTESSDVISTISPDITSTFEPDVTTPFITTTDASPNITRLDIDNSTWINDTENSNFSSLVKREVENVVTSFTLTEEEASWLGSLLLLGACLGAMVSWWVIGLGRRRAVLASALPRVAGWIMIAAASDVYMMYAGRFLTGVSLGVVTTAAPVYISEIAHSSIRGALSCIVQLGVNLGIFIAALLGAVLDWRGLAIFGSFSVVVYFIATFFIPDSPVWLVACGREDPAREALRKLRGPHYCVEYELQQIISTKASQYNAYNWRDVFTLRSCVVPLGVVALVTAVNRCSGYNAIITFCSTFLHQAIPSYSQQWAAAGVTAMQVVSTAGAVATVDQLGRRKLLMLSILIMGLSLVTISICEVASSNGAGGSWVGILAAIVYVSSYSLGVGPVTWVLVGEMFPQAARDKASAVIAVLNWFLAFVITKTYFGLENSTGIAGTCAVYATMCAVGLVLVYFLVPETKGRSLGEIEAHFTYARNPWGRPGSKRRDVAMSNILGEHEAATLGGMESYSTFSD